MTNVPDVKMVLVIRPRNEVIQSLKSIGLALDEKVMDRIDQNIHILEHLPNVFVVDYIDVNKLHKDIFRFIHNVECPDKKSALIDVNIQLSEYELQQIRNKVQGN